MSEFIKASNGQIYKKPNGADYDLIPGKVYTLKYDDWEGDIFKENGLMNMPKKIYKSESDDIFIKNVINAFNNSEKNTTGVLLAGEKGTGKTVTAKLIAEQSGLPIIVIDENYPAGRLINFFKAFETKVCILMDEVEKNYNTRSMLSFLDGIHKTAKKLVLMTCNDIDQVDKYFVDRASRVRYLREYTMKDNLIYLEDILKDLDTTDENRRTIYNYISNKMENTSIDNMYTLLEEFKIQDVDLSNKMDLEFIEKFTENLNIS